MPRAIRNARARAMQGRRAGIVTRLLADALDVAVAFVLYTGALYAYAVLHYLLTSKPLELPTPDTWVRILVAGGVALGYLASSWASTGRTIGAQVFGVCVVTEGGRPLSTGRAVARALLCMLIGGPSLVWVLVSRKNAAIHDLLCRTAVVYDWRGRALAVADAADT
ncbi:MAG TPA: RDD family protein [Acidimicrobiia bacterium]|nr:RDD family protein [Acidimicrobiia bacterium]